MQHHVVSEMRWVTCLIFIAALLGLVSGYFVETLLLASVLYSIYHVWQLNRLNQWLKNRNLNDIHDTQGLWGETLDQLSRQKRRELRDRNRLRSVIERVEVITAALNDGIVILDQHNILTWWNPSTTKLLDLKHSDIGSSIINFIRHPNFVNYLEHGDYERPLRLPSPNDSSTQLEFQFTRFGAGESLLVLRDVSHIHRLEQMRKDFVANVSHELRTPLTVIQGYLETLSDNELGYIAENPQWTKAFEQMLQQTSRMTSLINDLTVLSKLETDRIDKNQQWIPLKPLLDKITKEAEAVSREQHIIRLNCDDSLEILGNERELHSAFLNLATNAIKYSDPGKTVTINTKMDTEHLIVSVKDQGIGIEAEHIDRLTERFYRVDSSRSIKTGGTGLGLAIVKHILLRHNATLAINSEPNHGSVFSCMFDFERGKHS